MYKLFYGLFLPVGRLRPLPLRHPAFPWKVSLWECRRPHRRLPRQLLLRWSCHHRPASLLSSVYAAACYSLPRHDLPWAMSSAIYRRLFNAGDKFFRCATYSQALQRIQLFHSAYSLASEAFPGILVDLTGSYVPAYLCFAVFSFPFISGIQAFIPVPEKAASCELFCACAPIIGAQAHRFRGRKCTFAAVRAHLTSIQKEPAAAGSFSCCFPQSSTDEMYFPSSCKTGSCCASAAANRRSAISSRTKRAPNSALAMRSVIVVSSASE